MTVTIQKDIEKVRDEWCAEYVTARDQLDRLKKSVKRVMTKDQEDAIYAAYMGISVLSTICKKAELDMGRTRAEELLQELSKAFPTVYERVLLSALR